MALEFSKATKAPENVPKQGNNVLKLCQYAFDCLLGQFSFDRDILGFDSLFTMKSQLSNSLEY